MELWKDYAKKYMETKDTGDKIEAIKLYRQNTGVFLPDAKRAVEAYIDEVERGM